MANVVNLLPFYEVFYTSWSSTVHGSDGANLTLVHDDGTAEFKPLNDPGGLDKADGYVRIFLWKATRLLMNKFLSKEMAEALGKAI